MNLFDTVALVRSIDHSKIVVGQVGCIINLLGSQTFEVEFVDKTGFTIDIITLKESDLMILHFDEVRA